MKFDDIFEEAVLEAFSEYGVVGPVMLKDIESKSGVKASKWWKKPERVEEVILKTYGQGGRSITRNILLKLSRRLPEVRVEFDEDFGEAVRRLVEELKKSKGRPR